MRADYLLTIACLIHGPDEPFLIFFVLAEEPGRSHRDDPVYIIRLRHDRRSRKQDRPLSAYDLTYVVVHDAVAFLYAMSLIDDADIRIYGVYFI